MLFETVYKGVKIVVKAGDITEQRADALVNPANSLMIMGGGVAGALRRMGGEEIQANARKHAPVPVGKAIATTAGKLEATYVIHTPTMEKPAMSTDEGKIRLATKAALECAEDLMVETIVFPGLGTGVGGVSEEKAAGIMVKTIVQHINEGTKLRTIILLGYRENLTQAFVKAIKAYFV